ncbi:MAG: BlaI/MecI/CopY family transcriptional regulator [Bacteroidota bacterium]
MKEHLSPKEEQVMKILWRLQYALVREILEEIPDPKPPVTTLSSVVRKLEDRGLVGHKAFGKTHQYFPILKQGEYRKQAFRQLVSDYFSGSYEQLVSFFVKEENVQMEELEDILRKMKEKEDE